VAHVLPLVSLLFCAGWCWGGESSHPSIYALMESDGSLAFSNVPTDRRYTVLIGAAAESSRDPPAKARSSSSAGLAGRSLFGEIIEKTAALYGLESALLHAVIEVESGYEPNARSPKGARGLMQLMPGTATRYGVVNAFDPAQNIDGGARYLCDLLRMFDGDLSLVLAAYNAGENAVARNQNRIPPIRETEAYVPKVLAQYRRHRGTAPADRSERTHD
jgi:soluble lytic murein transglycosylase-like protein